MHSDSTFESEGKKRAFLSYEKTTPLKDFLICAAILLTTGFYYIDKHIIFDGLFKFVSLILMVYFWISCSVRAGKNKNKFFLILSYLFLIFPYAVKLLNIWIKANGGYVKIIALGEKLSALIIDYPFRYISDFIGTDTIWLYFAFAVNVMTFYILGVVIRNKYSVKPV